MKAIIFINVIGADHFCFLIKFGSDNFDFLKLTKLSLL